MKKRRFPVFLTCMLVFASPAAWAGDIPLAGTEWGLGEGDDRFVQFGSDGKVSGHAGCNRFFTSYVQTGRKLKLAGLATTRKLCADAAMRRERQWLALLERVWAIEMSHLKLVLYSSERTRLATLKRRDID